MHGRSGMPVDPRIPTTPERSNVGFSPTRQALYQAQSAVRYWASRMKGGVRSAVVAGGSRVTTLPSFEKMVETCLTNPDPNPKTNPTADRLVECSEISQKFLGKKLQ